MLVGRQRSRINRSGIELLNRPRPTEGCRVNRRTYALATAELHIPTKRNVYVVINKASQAREDTATIATHSIN